MILMIQKHRVTSGTLFSILRLSESSARDVMVVVMLPKIGRTAWTLPERVCDRPPSGRRRRRERAREPKLEASAGGGLDRDDVSTARAGQAAGQRQAEP